MDEACHLGLGSAGYADVLLLEAHPLIATQHRLIVAPVPTRDLSITLTDDRRHMGDLGAAGFARTQFSPERFECLVEKGTDKVRL